MNLYPGIITPKLAETRAFYVDVLGFGVKFETDWFLLLARDGAEVAFLKPDQPAQAPVFRAAFPGHGAWFAIEMDDVDAEYRRLRGLGVKMEVELRDEDWGERHFSIRDPNGVGLDFVRFAPPAQ